MKNQTTTVLEGRVEIQSLLDGLPLHACLLDRGSVIVMTNRAWKEFSEENGGTGGATGEGTSYIGACGGAARAGVTAAREIAEGITDIIEGRAAYIEAVYPCHAPNRERWFLARATPLQGVGGAAVLVTHENITEKAVAERRHEIALEAINDVVWDWNLSTGEVFISRACARILGCAESDLPEGGAEWLERLHPGDRLSVQAQITELLERGGSLEIEGRLRHARGHWIHALVKGRCIAVSPAGGAERLIGTLSDVTHRVRMEEDLRLASAAMNATANAIVISDREGIIKWANPAWTSLTGYEAREVLGETTNVLKSGMQDDKFYEDLWNQILGGEVWQGQLINKRKDGSLYTEEMTITPVRDATGEITHFIAVKEDISERKRLEEELSHRALTDSLTGLANRALLSHSLEHALNLSRRHAGRRFALLLVDLDRFKNVNDTLGHPAGDKVLMEVARRFLKATRSTDTVARLGGDEFAVLLEDEATDKGALIVAQRLLDAATHPFEVEGTSVEIGASIGVVLSASFHESPADLMRDADIALYRAKNEGRGRCQLFDQEMHRRVRERIELETELKAAVKAGAFVLHLQPIVSLASGRIASFEALVRWPREGHGYVSPADFIPLAEETGLIHGIGDWVARETCRIIRNWPGQAASVSINASPLEVASSPVVAMGFTARQFAVEGIDEKVARIAREEGVDPALLRIEVTEGVMISGNPRIREALDRLVTKGFRLLLDDFGTGYSSLACLDSLPFSLVKLDRAFVARITEEQRTRELLEGITKLAHTMELEVVAEGVETAEQLELVRAAGCDFAQGYYFSRALPVEEAWALYAQDPAW